MDFSSFYSVSRLLSTLASFMALSSAVQAQNDLTGFSVLPSNITVRISSPAQFDCQARPGAGFIRWAIGPNFEILSETNCDRCQLQTNGSLYIASVTPAHSGLYTCLIIGGSQPAMVGVYLTIATGVQCDDLEPPANGEITSCSSGVGYEGNTCSFMCNTGYELTGSDTRTCQSDGSWSGTDAVCNGTDDVPISNDSSSSDGGAIIGGVVGGVILLLMIIVVLCIVILCMRRRRRRETPHEYDQVLYNRTKLSGTAGVNIKHNPSYKATEDETADSLYSTNNEDVPITANSVLAVPNKTYDDTVQAVEETVDMNTNPSYGASTEDRAMAIDSDATAHRLSQQYDYDIHDDSVQLFHNIATDTNGDVEDHVQIHTTLDHTHATNSTKLIDEHKYEVINQPRCDDPTFDTTIDHNSTTNSCSPLTANSTMLTDKGNINQPTSDDLSFDATIDQSPNATSYLPLIANDARLTDEDKYGVINQPQRDDHM